MTEHNSTAKVTMECWETQVSEGQVGKGEEETEIDDSGRRHKSRFTPNHCVLANIGHTESLCLSHAKPDDCDSR